MKKIFISDKEIKYGRNIILQIEPLSVWSTGKIFEEKIRFTIFDKKGLHEVTINEKDWQEMKKFIDEKIQKEREKHKKGSI